MIVVGLDYDTPCWPLSSKVLTGQVAHFVGTATWHPPFPPVPPGLDLAAEQSEIVTAIRRARAVFQQRASEAP